MVAVQTIRPGELTAHEIATEAPARSHHGAPLDERSVFLGAVEALAGSVKRGKGGGVLPGILAGVVSSLALWGLHDAIGGRAEAERAARLEDRIERLEEQQAWIRWSLASIAKAVNADLPPEQEPRE